MKNYNFFFFIAFITLLSSCGSIKSTLKNVNNDTPKPQIVDDHYVITEYSKDGKYGYDKDYPINIGFDNERFATRSIGYFFNALLGPSGEKFTFEKVDNCCPFPTKRSVMGGGILDIYEIKFEGKEKTILLYINIFDKGKVLCPKGFTIKQ
jgi:hypothetical protein